jgi:hypothetical protein
MLCTFLFAFSHGVARRSADLAAGVAEQSVGTLWRKLISFSFRAGCCPLDQASVRQTTGPLFPTFKVLSATTLEHGLTETTHLASGTLSREANPTQRDHNRASLDGSDIVGAPFAPGRHTAQPDMSGSRSHLTRISCE